MMAGRVSAHGCEAHRCDGGAQQADRAPWTFSGAVALACYDHDTMAAPDTPDEVSRVQIEIYRRMTPGARLRLGLELTEMSRRLLADGIRRRHPVYDEEEVRLASIRVWLGPELFRSAYPGEREMEP